MATPQRTYRLRSAQHFYSTIHPDHQEQVLMALKTTPIENGLIIVNYSVEGSCIFEVIVDTPELLHVEFISTAS